ncbi:hypothetical protein QR680_008845 [Steinernema hermaphroditum]|uniref:Flavin-containing monooxygenase n=1 Tax=Steinernema hermaphroditum TaxID=289476 RepID=A0AA39M8E2_9BILA|nr:hypothetical protein QR680_008845 [Steinernema hermaphroditum]
MATSVAVIGAGAAGLLAAKRCVEDESFEVTVFEQTENVGGTWVYSPEVDVHSSMYEEMSTNIPKEIMFYPGVPLPEGACDESFVPHQVVRDYLENFSKDVAHLIKLGHKVEKVDRRDSKWSLTTSSKEGLKTEEFDVVFVCNGHYTDPSYPRMTHQFRGRAIRSHNYRNPREFKGETVAIVGAGFSGMDIALQVAEEAQKVHLLHRSPPKFASLPSNIAECQSLAGVTPDGHGLLLRDGAVLADVDSVIFCTGYNYSFPFFDDNIVRIAENGKVVSPLFLHMVHRDHPTSLFFIGIPFYVIPFVLFDYQVKFALSLVKGTAALTEEELHSFEALRMEHVIEKYGSKAMFHMGGSEMFDLMAEYAKRGEFEYSVHPGTAALFRHIDERREENVVGYKKDRYDRWFEESR